MSGQREVSRRQFVPGMASALCMAADSEDVVDVHGHPGIPAYHSEKWVLQHQRHHGIKTTMLLPIPAAAAIEKIGRLVNPDLSGASGSGAIARDREHWKSFATRHQDKLLFGSDCEHEGIEAEACWAGRTKQLVRMLGPSEAIVRQILSGNARRLLRQAVSK